MWEAALRQLGEDWVVAVEAEKHETIRAMVAQQHELPHAPVARMFRRSDGKLVAYAGDVHTLFSEGARPVKELLSLCPANALHLFLVATPSGDITTRLRGELGWCGTSGVLVHTGCVLESLLRHHMPSSAILAVVSEHDARLRDRRVFEQYLQDVMRADVVYLDTGDSDLVRCKRAWTSPFGTPAGAELPESHDRLETGWTPIGKVIGHAVDVIGPGLTEALLQSMRASRGVTRVSVPPRISCKVPVRFRCHFEDITSISQVASENSLWVFAGEPLALDDACADGRLDLSSVVLRALALPDAEVGRMSTACRFYISGTTV